MYNQKKLIKIVHYYSDKVYTTTDKIFSNKSYKRDRVKKGNVTVEYITNWNAKTIGNRNVEVVYSYVNTNTDDIVNTYKNSKTLDFLNDDYVEYTHKKSTKVKREVKLEEVFVKPVYDLSSIAFVEDKDFNVDYNASYIRKARIQSLRHFASQMNNNLTIDYMLRYEAPVQYTDGYSACGKANIFCKVGEGKLIAAASNYIPGDKKSGRKFFNELNNQVIYLLAVTMMNGKLEHKDINANIIYQAYLTVMSRLFNTTDMDLYPITIGEFKKQAEIFAKKFFSGNVTSYMTIEGVINSAFKLYGDVYTGVRYPKGYTLEDKQAYKADNNITRKQRNDSNEDAIRACYDKGMKQVDVVKELGISKSKVSEWYKKFKNELKK